MSKQFRCDACETVYTRELSPFACAVCKATNLKLVEFCHDVRHHEPCSLPCSACELECDPRWATKDGVVPPPTYMYVGDIVTDSDYEGLTFQIIRTRGHIIEGRDLNDLSRVIPLTLENMTLLHNAP